MHTSLSRAAAIAAVLVVALPTAAGAAVDDYAAEASTSAVKLSVFEGQVGDPVLDLIGTDAFGNSDPDASASIGVVEVLGTSVGEVRSAESDGERVSDPEEGDGCTLPVGIDGLTLSAICTTTTARAGEAGDQDANATADLFELAASGSLVSAALTEPLGDVFVAVGDLLVEGAVDQFVAECNEILDNEGSDIVLSGARDLFAMAPEELEPLKTDVEGVVEEADDDGFCAAVFNLTVTDLSDAVLDVGPVADALDGVDLVELNLDGASSDVVASDGQVTAAAEQVFVSITGPSLDFLDDVLVAIVDAIEAEVIEIAGVEPPEQLDLQAALDQIPLFGITDPLLTAVVSGGAANATLDLDSGDASAGGDKPFVQVSVAGGIMELFGQDPESGTVTLESGESQTIAEDTPLESTISVGAVTVDDDAEFEDTGLRGSSATASATSVSLLTGVEGGIVLDLALSRAGVYGSTVSGSEAPPEEDMPHTGGGAAFAAALALGAALVMRRRRD